MNSPLPQAASAATRALRAIEQLEARLELAERAHREPIAVIGIGCRFPGDVNGPESYRELLRAGRDVVSEVPRERWSLDDWYDPAPEARGKSYCRHGAFLSGVDTFDAEFFRISPHEAARMDPQQRLSLEVAWEALEHARIPVQQLAGSDTGVFMGVAQSEYTHQLDTQRIEDMDLHRFLGVSLDFNAARVAYSFGFHGPAMVVDTACSSSLVALHLACQSLRANECKLALAGGVNVLLSPESYVIMSRGRMLSRSGRCRTFDASADGIVRGEGCGIVVLKRLSRALADHDHVLAVIRGSAVNQDGASSGLTVPNRLAQEMLLRSALAAAGVEPHEVGYVEAHGTGTPLGDPIELRALAAALCTGRAGNNPLRVGSVKTNMGHLESASGIAGFIKTVLTLEHAEIFPHLHLEHPTEQLCWSEYALEVPRVLTPWQSTRRLAGVSGFGASGTNAHLILESPPAQPSPACQGDARSQVLALSAKSGQALRAQARRYLEHLAQHPEQSLAALCTSANLGRSHLEQRKALLCASRAQLTSQLADADDWQMPPLRTAKGIRVVFVFGSGPDLTPGRLQELDAIHPAFARALDRCQNIVTPWLGQSLRSLLSSDSGGFATDTRCADAARFACQWSLCELWRSWGVEPHAVLGLGLGEYVAACVAGVFSLEQILPALVERTHIQDAAARGTGIRGELERLFGALTLRAPQLLLATDRSPALLGASAAKPAYWCNEAHADSQLGAAADALMAAGANTFLELGSSATQVSTVLLASQPAAPFLSSREPLASLGRLYELGAAIDWRAFYAGQPQARVDLPSYAFQRKRYWIERAETRVQPPASPCPRVGQSASLLGTRLALPGLAQQVFQTPIGGTTRALSAQLRAFGVSLVPTGALLELAMQAASRWDTAALLLNVGLLAPLTWPEQSSSTLQVVLEDERAGASLHALSFATLGQGADSRLHLRATLQRGSPATQSAAQQQAALAELALLRERASSFEPERLYALLGALGLEVGNGLRSLVQLGRHADEALAELRLPASMAGEADGYRLHPALLEGCLLCAAPLLHAPQTAAPSVYRLAHADQIELHAPGSAALSCHVTLQPDRQPDGSRSLDLRAFEPDTGRLVLSISGARFVPMTREATQQASASHGAGGSEERPDGLLAQWRKLDEAQRFDALLAQVRMRACELLGLTPDEAPADERELNDCGLDSMMAIDLCELLSSDLGQLLPAELVLDQPSVESLSRRIAALLCAVLPIPTPAARAPGSLATARLLPPRASRFRALPERPAATLRLLCIPFAGGSSYAYQSWAQHLPASIELCTAQLPGRDERRTEPAHRSIGAMVDELWPELERLRERPFALFGHSMGAVVAFELARRLRREGRVPPVGLIVSGRPAPQLPRRGTPIHPLDDASFLRALRRYEGSPHSVMGNEEVMRVFLPTLRAEVTAIEQYEARHEPPLTCPIVACGGTADEGCLEWELAAWQQQTDARFRLQLFPGGHFYFRGREARLLGALVAALEMDGNAPATNPEAAHLAHAQSGP